MIGDKMNMLREYSLWTVLLVLVLTTSSTAFENPTYITSKVHPVDSTVDTLAILTFLSDPAYLESTELEIAWIVRDGIKDSLRVAQYRGHFGQLCSIDVDRLSHTWLGDFTPPDTLRCRFVLTPLEIGLLEMAFRVELYGGRWKALAIRFNLDETGRVVDDPGKLDYGCFGLAPEHIRGPLRFVDQCYDNWTDRPVELFGIVAEIDPPPGSMGYSNLVVTARPTTDIEQGAYFKITYDDIFDIQLESDSDWLGPVKAGEELVINAKVKPVRSGVGVIQIDVVGFRPEHEPTEKRGIDRGGKIQNYLTMNFAIDEDLNVVAYHRLPLTGMAGRDESKRNDAHRASVVDGLRVKTETKRLHSANFLTRQKELSDELWKKKHPLDGN